MFLTVHSGFKVATCWHANLLPEANSRTASIGMRELHSKPAGTNDSARPFRFTQNDAKAHSQAQVAYLIK